MKLTKGKISKLYNKRKQSLKKQKLHKKKSSSKNKTFRRKRNMNLANTSLKNIYFKKTGGVSNDTSVSGEKIDNNPKLDSSEVPVDNTTTTIVDSSQPEGVKTEELAAPEGDKTEIPLVPEGDKTEMPVVPEGVVGSEGVETEMPVVPEEVVGSEGVVVPEGVVGSEGVETEMPVAPEGVVAPEEEDGSEIPVAAPEGEDGSEIPVVAPEGDDGSELPVASEVADNTIAANGSEQNITQAFNTVVDYIADKVAVKIEHLSVQQPNKTNDGFDSNVNAAEETANLLNSSSSTGGKKTRKFRITNKKNSRHQKK